MTVQMRRMKMGVAVIRMMMMMIIIICCCCCRNNAVSAGVSSRNNVQQQHQQQQPPAVVVLRNNGVLPSLRRRWNNQITAVTAARTTADQRPRPSSSVSSSLPAPASSSPTATATSIAESLSLLQLITFIVMYSSSIVALLPVQILLQIWTTTSAATAATTITTTTITNTATATRYLSIITTIAAIVELMGSPILGKLLDRTTITTTNGPTQRRRRTRRKNNHTTILSSIVAIQWILHIITTITVTFVQQQQQGIVGDGTVVNHGPRRMLLTIMSLQKCIGTIAIGFFLVTIQTMITNLVLTSTTTSTSTTTTTTATSRSNTNTNTSKNNNNNNKMVLSSVLGQQMAIIGMGFLFGLVSAGIISSQFSGTTGTTGTSTSTSNTNTATIILYSIAAILMAMAYLLIQWKLGGNDMPHQHDDDDDTDERHATTTTTTATRMNRAAAMTVPSLTTTRTDPSVRTTTTTAAVSLGRHILDSVLSCTNLLVKYDTKTRILSLLLMIMTLPMFMGDVFQIYAKTEWNLSTAMFSTYLSLFAITGIASNIVGSVLIQKLGIRTFTQLAIVSKMIPSVLLVMYGYRGSIIGIIVGFLGNAQSIGIVAALLSQSSSSLSTTTPGGSTNTSNQKNKEQQQHTTVSSQGVMAGERASLMALLKVIGPILYSTLYIQGRYYFNTSSVPFLFNILLSIIALLLSSYYL